MGTTIRHVDPKLACVSTRIGIAEIFPIINRSRPDKRAGETVKGGFPRREWRREPKIIYRAVQKSWARARRIGVIGFNFKIKQRKGKIIQNYNLNGRPWREKRATQPQLTRRVLYKPWLGERRAHVILF